MDGSCEFLLVCFTDIYYISYGQVLMIQPIMVTSHQSDGQIVQQTQYQIIRQSDDSDIQNQVLQFVFFMFE